MCEIPAESREREKVELMVKSDICKRRKNIQGTQKENDLFLKFVTVIFRKDLGIFLPFYNSDKLNQFLLMFNL